MFKVTEQIWRGPDAEKQLHRLKADGFTEIVALRSGFGDVLDGRLYSLETAARLMGIEVNYFPQGFIRHPTHDETAEVVNFLASITRRDRRTKVFVHCQAGVDRTGWMIAAYRVLLMGWAVDDAVAEWKQMGHHRFRYFWWERGFRAMMADWKRAEKARWRGMA